MSEKPISSLAKIVVERAIMGCADLADRKERIMIAREEGIFTDREAQDWIAIIEARAA